LVFVGFLVIVGFSLSSFTGAENLPCVFATAQRVRVGMLCDDMRVHAIMPRGFRFYALCATLSNPTMTDVAGNFARRAQSHKPRSDVHEEALVKTGARRLRDFPDTHSASSAKQERRARVCGHSHSTPRRRNALVVGIEPNIKHGCLLKSMYLGNAATGFHVTRLTKAAFIVSTPKRARRRFDASVDHTDPR
jgi:hypothetical protein